jgi:hypothetical protein
MPYFTKMTPVNGSDKCLITYSVCYAVTLHLAHTVTSNCGTRNPFLLFHKKRGEGAGKAMRTSNAPCVSNTESEWGQKKIQ